MAGQPGANSKIQIVRCRKSDDSRIVGERSFWNSLKPPSKGRLQLLKYQDRNGSVYAHNEGHEFHLTVEYYNGVRFKLQSKKEQQRGL